MVDLHVQADPLLSLHDAHILSGKVKGAVRTAVPAVRDVLVHMEPFEDQVEEKPSTYSLINSLTVMPAGIIGSTCSW